MSVAINLTACSYEVMVLSCDPHHRPVVQRVVGRGKSQREAVYDVLANVLTDRPRKMGPPIFISCGQDNLLLGNIIIHEPKLGLPTYVKVGVRDNGDSVVAGSQEQRHLFPGERPTFQLFDDHYEEI